MDHIDDHVNVEQHYGEHSWYNCLYQQCANEKEELIVGDIINIAFQVYANLEEEMFSKCNNKESVKFDKII